MCWMVFVATQKPLPIVPWNEAAQDFAVEELGAEFAPVAQWLTPPHVYAALSYQGCGCGFVYYGEEARQFLQRQLPASEKVEAEQGFARSKADVGKLRALIEDGLTAGPVEVLTCWYGDWHTAPNTRPVPLAHFGGDEFGFNDGERLIVSL